MRAESHDDEARSTAPRLCAYPAIRRGSVRGGGVPGLGARPARRLREKVSVHAVLRHVHPDDAWETEGVRGVVTQLAVRVDLPQESPHGDLLPQSSRGTSTEPRTPAAAD